MKFIIHRGTKEIGGTCIEVLAEDTRIIIDVGMPLVDDRREPFDRSTLKGKSDQQMLDEGILPRVKGLFCEGTPPDAVLLSHAHLDHVGLLTYANPDIPVYATKGTSKMMMAGALFAGQPSVDRQRLTEMKAREPISIGNVRVTPYAVDHSAFDAVALLIEANGRNLLYTGDLRLHGRKPGMAKELVRAIQGKRIHTLLMEGTHFGTDSEQGKTEHELEAEIIQHIRNAPGLVLAAFSPMDVDRFVTYFKSARQAGRILVVDVYAAYVLHLAAGQAKIPRPTRDAGIRVYYNQNFLQKYRNRGLQKIHELFRNDQIELAEFLADESQYVMAFRTAMKKLDFKELLPARVTCLYSYWDGYLKNPDWVDLRSHLESIGGKFITAHVSGHIYRDDIVSFVEKVNPEKVVPIHTFEPELFENRMPNVWPARDGEILEV